MDSYWRVGVGTTQFVYGMQTLGKTSRLINEHKGKVKSVAFSPEGHTLTSGGKGHIVFMGYRHRATEETLPAHPNGFYVVKYSPNGKTLLIMSNGLDSPIQLWDVDTGQQKLSIKGHTGIIRSITYSPDGKKLASGLDGEIWLWDVETKQHKLTLEGHARGINSLAYSPDNRTLASGCKDGMDVIELWDTDTGQHTLTLTGHTGSIGSLTFSPDGEMLASASNDHTIRLWDVFTREEMQTLVEEAGAAFSVSFSPDGRTLASGGFNGTIRLWNVDLGQQILTLPDSNNMGDGHSIAYSPDGKRLAVFWMGYSAMDFKTEQYEKNTKNQEN